MVERPSLDYTGRRVLVAGGSKGIGRAMALAFAAAGARVSVCARGEPGLAALRADAARSRERILEAYAAARRAGYRFYSFGDAMFIV